MKRDAVDKEVLLEKLATVRHHLEIFEGQLSGIGHNQPPEPIDPAVPSKNEIEQARFAIDDLVLEISKPSPNPDIVADRSHRLSDFGLKVALWLGERATKFVDAAIATAVPIGVVTATGLLPQLIEVVKEVARLVGLS